MKFSEVLEALDSANPDGVPMLLRWNSSEKEVSYVVSKVQSCLSSSMLTLPHICKLLSFKRYCLNPLKVVQCLLAPLLSCQLTCLLACKYACLATLTTFGDQSAVSCSFCKPHLCKCFQSASGKGAACVDTVASACRLSLLFGEDKVMASRGLQQAWED